MHKEWNKRFRQLYTAVHVRILRHAPMCVRVRSYCNGRNGRVTYVTFASIVRVCIHVCASLTPTKGMYAADSLGPEDISQKGRRRSRSNPEGCSFSQPSGSLSSFPLSSSSSPPRPYRLGSKAKASPLLHLRREQPCNSNETLPVLVYPGSRLRREVRPYSKRVQETSPAEKLRVAREKPLKIRRSNLLKILFKGKQLFKYNFDIINHPQNIYNIQI